MERPLMLAGRLREVLLTGHWIANTNYKEQLLDLTWDQTIQKISSLNSIAALTFHVNYYQAGILNVFNGGVLEIKDQFSFDLPPITSKGDWDRLLNEFLANAEKFANHLEQMPDEDLDKPFTDAKYGTWLRNMEGVIEHSYYHLGQISLIKKMICGR